MDVYPHHPGASPLSSLLLIDPTLVVELKPCRHKHTTRKSWKLIRKQQVALTGCSNTPPHPSHSIPQTPLLAFLIKIHLRRQSKAKTITENNFGQKRNTYMHISALMVQWMGRRACHHLWLLKRRNTPHKASTCLLSSLQVIDRILRSLEVKRWKHKANT